MVSPVFACLVNDVIHTQPAAMADSPESGAVLERSPDSGQSGLDALFFVVIALFLGKHQHRRSLQQLQHLEICASAGVFTKHVLAWTRIPFTALLLVSCTFLPILLRSSC